MNPQMRKAAILITSLDRAAAESLLAQMPKDVAKRVLAAAKLLGKIDPKEQSEVMRDFVALKSGKSPVTSRPSAEGSDVELTLSSGAESRPEPKIELPQDSKPLRPIESKPGQRFAFITEEWTEPLASLLGREQPQLAALILAHLPAERSAAVLSLVGSSTRLGILQRIAEIDETAPEVLDEIEQELKTRLMRERLKVDGSAAGLAALSGILQASDPELRSEISTAMGSRRAEKILAATPSEPAPVASDVAEEQETEVEETEVEALPVQRESAQVIAFSGLTLLDDVSLAAVFGSVSPQVAILALVGAEETLVRRILKVLPRKEAAAFRKKLDEVGPLRLKEVELAQSQLSQAAGDLLQKRRISLPIPQRVRLAA